MADSFTDTVEDIFEQIDNLIVDPQKRANAYIGFISYVGYDSSSQAITSTVEDATAAYFRRLAITKLTNAASEIEFMSSTDAKSFLDQIRPIYDAEVVYCLNNMDATNCDLFQNMKSSIVNQILSYDSDLPYLMDYTTKRSLPACVVAQEYYGDGSRDDEIILRNVPIHPAFLDTTVEILSY